MKPRMMKRWYGHCKGRDLTTYTHNWPENRAGIALTVIASVGLSVFAWLVKEKEKRCRQLRQVSSERQKSQGGAQQQQQNGVYTEQASYNPLTVNNNNIAGYTYQPVGTVTSQQLVQPPLHPSVLVPPVVAVSYFEVTTPAYASVDHHVNRYAPV